MVCWQIADISVEVQCETNPFPQSWQCWKSEYQKPLKLIEASVIHITATPVTSWDYGRGRLNWSSNAGETGRLASIEVEVPGGRGVFEWDAKKRLCGRFFLDANNDGALESVVLIGIDLILGESGVVLHSSGVLRDGMGWLFSGPSGSGKSTIATELSENGRKFSEDSTLLRIDADHQLWAFSTPFGEIWSQVAHSEKVPVAGVVFIEQSDTTAVEEMSGMALMHALYCQTRCFQRDVFANQRFLNVAEKIVATGLCCKLKFRKEALFWPLLDDWRRKRLESA